MSILYIRCDYLRISGEIKNRRIKTS